jgi:hypothetical protein
MKKLSILFLALAFMASSAGVANAVNLLVNGSLDLPGTPGSPTFTGWNKDESKTLSGPAADLISQEPWIEVGPSTNGDPNLDFGGFVKAFQGNNTTGDRATLHLYQDVASAPSVQYSLNGWFNAGANYSGLLPGATQTLLSIEFDNDAIYDNGNDGIRTAGVDYISIATTNVGASGLVAGGGPGMPGQQFSVTGTSPAGTLFARAKASMVEGYNTQNPDPSMFIDDFSLDVVPEPASASLCLLALGAVLGFARRR